METTKPENPARLRALAAAAEYVDKAKRSGFVSTATDMARLSEEELDGIEAAFVKDYDALGKKTALRLLSEVRAFRRACAGDDESEVATLKAERDAALATIATVRLWCEGAAINTDPRYTATQVAHHVLRILDAALDPDKKEGD